jgi:hypothetical protein
MKKGLVVLLILAMAGAAFAQEIKVSGAVKAGVLFEQVGDADMTVRPHNDSTDSGAGGKALRADLNVAATYDNYGAKLRIRNDEGVFALHQALVWGEFLNDLIKVSAGKLSGNAVWGSGGDADVSFDGVSGVRFEFKPIEGLNFGFALDAGSLFSPAVAAKPATPAIPAGPGTPAVPATPATPAVPAAPLKIGQFFKETVFGVKYSNDFFGAAFALKLDSDAGYDANVDSINAFEDKDGSDEYTKLLFGLDIKAVPGLTAVVDGQISQLGVEDKEGVGQGVHFKVHEKFAYQLSDPFEVHIVFAEAGYLGEAKDTEIAIKPGLSFEVLPAFFLNGDAEFTIYTFEDSAVQIGIKPGVEYKFADNTSIAGWYKATINKDGFEDNDLVNQIQIDFNWSF